METRSRRSVDGSLLIVDEDSHWECTAAMQRDLIALYTTDKQKWQQSIRAMIHAHPSKFRILNVGANEPSDYLFSFDEFASHFQGHQGSIDNRELLRLIYDDMDSFDGTHIKFLAIHRWMNPVKAAKQTGIVKDHHWLFAKLKDLQLAHFDADSSGKVSRDVFVAHFVSKEEVDEVLANRIFDDIDVNDDGDLSVMELAKWKSKHYKAKKLRKFFRDAKKKKKHRSSESSQSNESINTQMKKAAERNATIKISGKDLSKSKQSLFAQLWEDAKNQPFDAWKDYEVEHEANMKAFAKAAAAKEEARKHEKGDDGETSDNAHSNSRMLYIALMGLTVVLVAGFAYRRRLNQLARKQPNKVQCETPRL